MNDSAKTIIGASGEHFVSAMLSGLGLIVALPRGGVPTTDLIVTDQTCNHSVAVQVKTGTNPFNPVKSKPEESYFAWHTGAKAIERTSPSLWYAYGALNGWPQSEQMPEVFFVPSAEVARVVYSEQQAGHKRFFFWISVEDARLCAGIRGAQRLMDWLQRRPSD
jgi:hypothetical protein